MASIDKFAIIWSIAIVIVAVEIAIFGNTSEIAHHDNEIDVTQSESENQISSIHLQTDKKTYTINDKINISGYVSNKLSDTPITIIIVAPDNNIISIAQLTVDNNRTFSETVLIDGPLWEQDGRHVIEARYGKVNSTETSFDLLRN